jgi:hypothetical protein
MASCILRQAASQTFAQRQRQERARYGRQFAAQPVVLPGVAQALPQAFQQGTRLFLVLFGGRPLGRGEEQPHP